MQLAVISQFDLEIFQSPSGNDFKTINNLTTRLTKRAYYFNYTINGCSVRNFILKVSNFQKKKQVKSQFSI